MTVGAATATTAGGASDAVTEGAEGTATSTAAVVTGLVPAAEVESGGRVGAESMRGAPACGARGIAAHLNETALDAQKVCF